MAWMTVRFDDNGGSGGPGSLCLNYEAHTGSYKLNYWATRESSYSEYRKTSIEIPSKDGFVFSGYASGSYILVDYRGNLPTGSYSIDHLSATLTATWDAGWIIAFDKGGGTGGSSALYCKVGGGLYSDKECTVPATSITPPTNVGKIFDGYFSSDRKIKYINADGSFTSELTSLVPKGRITLYAGWSSFGNTTDYYSLETANGPLMLVASNSGATRSVVETSHSGALDIQAADSSVGAFERGGILMNPVCTYRIRSAGSVSIQLGKAWRGSGSTVSGYMIVAAEYNTAADVEPVLVVRGAANEGADAINRWNVNLAVNPDHIVQDPMAAVSGGGEMTECKTLITCDPVVPMENGMPCASDVVHGKVVVTATTNAYLGEAAPTERSPFVEINGAPPDESDVDFTTYTFQAERSF